MVFEHKVKMMSADSDSISSPRSTPVCLRQRYEAIDKLISDLRTNLPEGSGEQLTDTAQPGVKLLCDFWSILKEEPNFDLQDAIKTQMSIREENLFPRQPLRLQCYMSDTGHRSNSKDRKIDQSACSSRGSQKSAQSTSSKGNSTGGLSSANDCPQLAKCLVNLKGCASETRKCNEQIKELIEMENNLQAQVKELEKREKESVELLKEAEKMWTQMEETYKKKITDNLEKQREIYEQLKKADACNDQCRRNLKDLQTESSNVEKCGRDMKLKIAQKQRDLKSMDSDIENIKKRITQKQKDAENAKTKMEPLKSGTDKKIANIFAGIKDIMNRIKEEKTLKSTKEKEGKKFVNEARQDLTKLNKTLVQKNAEIERLNISLQAIKDQVEDIKNSSSKCAETCQSRQAEVIKEIAELDKEIAAFKLRCVQCHQSIDTSDVRRYCADCPRCAEHRECLAKDGVCTLDPKYNCVCMEIKRQFLDNVFDNMYNVLAKNVATRQGKGVANTMLKCLKKSTNGKLDAESRAVLQNFILSTLKNNLKLTIVGGAVKTRCEMNDSTYKSLQQCLDKIKVPAAPKSDQGTETRKPPCRRFGGPGECHCKGGPTGCICANRAPPPAGEPKTCPPAKRQPLPSDAVTCPNPCPESNPTLATPDTLSPTKSEMMKWQQKPCKEHTCKGQVNMDDISSQGSFPSGCPSLTNPHVRKAVSKSIMGTCCCGQTQCTCSDKTIKASRSTSTINTGYEIRLCSGFPRSLKTDLGVNTPTAAIRSRSGSEGSILKKKRESMKVGVNYSRNKCLVRGMELKATPSGNVIVNLGDVMATEFKDFLKNKIDIYGTVVITESGEKILDFTTTREKGSRKILVERTTSGIIFLRVPSYLFKKLKKHDDDSKRPSSAETSVRSHSPGVKRCEEIPLKSATSTSKVSIEQKQAQAHYHSLSIRRHGVDLTSCKAVLKPTTGRKFEVILDEYDVKCVPKVFSAETSFRVLLKKFDKRHCVIDLDEISERRNGTLTLYPTGVVELNLDGSTRKMSKILSTAQTLMKEVVGDDAVGTTSYVHTPRERKLSKSIYGEDATVCELTANGFEIPETKVVISNRTSRDHSWETLNTDT